MSEAYSQKANGWILHSQLKNPTQKQTLKAFINDINLFISQPQATSKQSFLSMAQADINQWHGILWATGGKLNAKKSFWSNVNFNYNKHGNPHIRQCEPTDPQLYLTNPDRTQAILCSTKPHKGICHLGVNISMNGNHKAEEHILIKHCHLFQKVFSQCPLTRAEVEVTYKTIFLLTITYPFPATFLSKTILEKAQSLTMPLILSKLSYNQNMPKSVVYTPTSHGRLGLCHLHTEQGLQKILQTMKHIRARTSLGTLRLSLIKHKFCTNVGACWCKWHHFHLISIQFCTNCTKFLGAYFIGAVHQQSASWCMLVQNTTTWTWQKQYRNNPRKDGSCAFLFIDDPY